MPSVSADHIASARGCGLEPQRANNFGLSIPGLTRTPLAVQQVTWPEYEAQIGEVRIGNLMKKFAQGVRFGSVTLGILEAVNWDLFMEFERWWKQVFDGKDQIFPATKYKKDGSLFWLGPNGGSARTWSLQGLWPSRLSPGAGEMAGGVVVMQMTLEVDIVTRQ